MARKTLTQKLEAARLLIFNSRDTTIAPLLDAIGIDSAYLDQGEALYNETMQLIDDQKTEYQEQNLAYDKFYLEKDEVEASYSRTLKMVKVLARNDKDIQNRLKLQTEKAFAIEEWIQQATDFYKSLLHEKKFLTTLERFKITTEQLNAEKAAVENLKQLRNEAIAEKGEAQEATRLKNEKLDQLDNYCIELKAISKIALEEQSQLMEKLGIVVPS
jgi:hypothetical protein